MESDERAIPGSREELVEAIQLDITKTHIMTGKAFRATGAALLILAPVLWYSIDFIGDNWSNVDSIAYLFAVAGFLVLMSISATGGGRFLRIVIKNIPNWIGQTTVSVSLLISIISYATLASVIGLVGEWRLPTMPLFFVCYSLSVISAIFFVRMRMGKKEVNWESVRIELEKNRSRSRRSNALIIVMAASFALALYDISTVRNELLSLINIEGMLLLLALMGLAIWFAVSISVLMALTFYEDELKNIHSTASRISTREVGKIWSDYVKLTKNGPQNRRKKMV